jgi:hypothetical protein
MRRSGASMRAWREPRPANADEVRDAMGCLSEEERASGTCEYRRPTYAAR